MKQSARVIAHSRGPNGKEIVTIECDHLRFIHPELLRHRLFSFSVASSRAIPYSKQREQVANDPMMPILWPKQHSGMQGTEVFTPAPHASDDVHVEDIELNWRDAKNDALNQADALSKMGLSKQLTNRLLEPWVSTRCVITSTEWDNFFRLRHPWHYELSDKPMIGNEQTNEKIKGRRIWESEPNLSFPAEYNIQDLAIKIKAAIDASEPTVLKEGEWHLPFMDEEALRYTWDSMGSNETEEDKWTESIKISAARAARTSYGKSLGKTVEDDLKLAEMLISSNHWSPFEHQAQAMETPSMRGFNEGHPKDYQVSGMFKGIPEGCEIRIEHKVNDDWKFNVWSRNFKGWVQARSLLDT